MPPAETRDSSPGDHLVLFYDHTDELIGQLGGYLLPAIQDGGLAVAIATPGHRIALDRWLTRAGADLGAARANGHYLDLDAAEVMHEFIVGNWPDPAQFWAAISPLIGPAADSGRPVRVFGEMVALLWEAGQVNAAIELEAMWNELGSQYAFSLCCGYPVQSVTAARYRDALAQVGHLHAAAVGAPNELV